VTSGVEYVYADSRFYSRRHENVMLHGTVSDRYECEKRIRQESEDKLCQISDKLGFDTRMHDQVLTILTRY